VGQKNKNNSGKIDQKELAICRKRGHEWVSESSWTPCKYCGMWLRKVCTIEERDTRPPEEEISTLHHLQDELKKKGW
jgi:hypothetical protein